MATELVHANPQVDVDGVVRADRGSRVIGVTFADESRRVVYFDPAFEGMARSLGRAIPNLPLIDFVESSADGNRLLIHAGSDSDPGRYFVYDKTAGTSTRSCSTGRSSKARLASVRPSPIWSADGVNIRLLTLPPGSGRNCRRSCLHGGPEARDEWGFDWLAQYFAQLGYAVLQPNYRGSGGFGDEWLQRNGFQGWRTSIGDISAGARWLAAQGIGDPNRMAIVGWSYGGYAALQSGVTDPNLFKAIVAIAPVTDLQQLKDDYRYFASRRNIAEYIGTGPHIREGSPVPNASGIIAPVLLFHGDRDLNVRVIHSQNMDRALRNAGRQSQLVVFPGLEHDLGDSEARRRMLDQIRSFLAGRLGPSQAVATTATP
jgi:dipeptidyl aminopeptidase/acylaminoacyl peptidase